MTNWWYKQAPWKRGIIFGIFAFVLEFTFDLSAHVFDYDYWEGHMVEDVVSGLIYAAIGYWLARAHDQAVKKRVDEMAYLNHHVRNALQSIALAHAYTQNAEELDKVIRESIARIVETITRIAEERNISIEELLNRRSDM